MGRPPRWRGRGHPWESPPCRATGIPRPRLLGSLLPPPPPSPPAPLPAPPACALPLHLIPSFSHCLWASWPVLSHSLLPLSWFSLFPIHTLSLPCFFSNQMLLCDFLDSYLSSTDLPITHLYIYPSSSFPVTLRGHLGLPSYRGPCPLAPALPLPASTSPALHLSKLHTPSV